MNGRRMVVVIAIAVAGALGGSSPGAAVGGEPWEGRFEAEPVRPPECASPVGICTAGRLIDAGTGKVVATYEFTMLTMTPTGDGARMSFTGESLLTKTSGAPGELRGEDTGTFEPQPDGAAAIDIAISIVSGSDSYHRSSGTLRASGRLDGSSGRTSGSYVGVIRR